MNITNKKIVEYLEGLYKPVNRELELLRTEAEERHIPIILKDAEAFLLNIIRMRRPERILEIGTAVGYSAVCFASAASEAEIISLEVNEDLYRKAMENVERCGLSERIRIIPGDASESLKELQASLTDPDAEGFDLVFIDAAKSRYTEFWEGCIPLCRKGAVILSDNVLLKARTASDEYVTERRQKTSVRRMREYIDYIMKLEYADTAVLAIGDGIAFSILKG